MGTETLERKKGVMGLPPLVIAGMLSFLVIMGVLVSGTGETAEFVSDKGLQLQLDRIYTSTLLLNSIHEGHLEFGLDGYKFKLDSGKAYLKHSENERSLQLPDTEEMDYGEYDGPSDYTEIDGQLCLQKTSSKLNFKPEGCS